jgi:hypothetical protein
MRIYTATPHTPAWHSAYLVKHRANFTVTFYFEWDSTASVVAPLPAG